MRRRMQCRSSCSPERRVPIIVSILVTASRIAAVCDCPSRGLLCDIAQELEVIGIGSGRLELSVIHTKSVSMSEDLVHLPEEEEMMEQERQRWVEREGSTTTNSLLPFRCR